MHNHPHLLSTRNLIGDRVVNTNNETVGKIEGLVSAPDGCGIGYAVMSLADIFGSDNKFFPVPWTALRVEPTKKSVVLAVDNEKLVCAPGFHKENWPDMTDHIWNKAIHCYYNQYLPWDDSQ